MPYPTDGVRGIKKLIERASHICTLLIYATHILGNGLQYRHSRHVPRARGSKGAHNSSVGDQVDYYDHRSFADWWTQTVLLSPDVNILRIWIFEGHYVDRATPRFSKTSNSMAFKVLFFSPFSFWIFPFATKWPPQFQLGDLGRYKPAGLSGAVANTLLAYLEPRNRGVWWLQMSLYFCWTKSENWNCMWKLFKIFISGMF